MLGSQPSFLNAIMKSLFVSAFKLNVCLTLCSFLCCIGAEQCGVMVTVSSQGDYLASLDNIVAVFKAKCRKNTVDSTSGFTTASLTTEVSMASEKHETSTNPTTTSVTTQLIAVTPSSGWPQGKYGLPMPTTGCPVDGAGFNWKNGTRHHDTDNVNSKNEWSSNLHLQGPYGDDDMVQSFCMKTDNTETDEWPRGNYCVFKYKNTCPNNMLDGFIRWDDENTYNGNQVEGTVPSGIYSQDTLIYYCCMTGGDVSQPISLPTQNPFYLFPYNSELCQAVQGMMATEEYFTWDQDSWYGLESQGSHPYKVIDSGKLKISYCYYSDK